jgi:CDP-diglyceride synthetase
VTLPRQRQWTLIFMTALAVVAALVTALCIGYRFGRRSGSPPPSWKKRTSRVTLGRLAVGLVALVVVRRIRLRLLPGLAFPNALGVRRLASAVYEAGFRALPSRH